MFEDQIGLPPPPQSVTSECIAPRHKTCAVCKPRGVSYDVSLEVVVGLDDMPSPPATARTFIRSIELVVFM